MKMMSMKMSAEEKKKAMPGSVTSKEEGPEYPYGLCLNLEQDMIDKLGIGTPKAGSKMMLHARIEVRSVTVSDQADGKGYKSMSLQITDMALEKPGMDMAKAEKALYGKE